MTTYIIGELIDGKISEENILDFNKIGINEKAIVKQIEEVRKIENNILKNWIALKIQCENNENIEYKVNNRNSELLIDILEKNNNFC